MHFLREISWTYKNRLDSLPQYLSQFDLKNALSAQIYDFMDGWSEIVFLFTEKKQKSDLSAYYTQNYTLRLYADGDRFFISFMERDFRELSKLSYTVWSISQREYVGEEDFQKILDFLKNATEIAKLAMI